MAYQYPLNGGRLNASINPGGNTAGVPALISTGTIHLAGGNNVTLSQNGASVTISGANIPSQTAYQFSNSNGVSFGTNGSTVTATVATNYAASNHSHGNPTLNLTNLSGTTASASNGLTLSLSAPAQSVQTQGIQTINLGGNTSGVMASISSGALSLYGGDNITLSQNANSVTISGAAGGGGGGGVALSANALISSGTASLVASGALTASVNGQTLNLSAPATSMLSAMGGMSISTTGATIAFSAPNANPTIQNIDYYQNMDRGAATVLAVPFANSLMLQRLNQENDVFAGNITANTVLLNMSANMSTSQSRAHTVSAYIGIYTDNATNLSLLNSASTTWAMGAATNNTTAYHGPRWLSFVSSQWSAAPVFSQGGDYVFGILMKSSSYAPPMSYYGQSYMVSNQRSGYLGASTAANTTMAHGNFWNAIMATASLPSSINSTQVNRNNASAVFMPHIILNNRYSSL